MTSDAGTTYAAVVATRNRPAALALSLPLLLAQEPPPREVVVVDSSDDPGPNRALVARLAAEGHPLRHRASARGSSLQRNLGMDEVEADVLLFPDDDSLLHPGAMAAILRVYDLDGGGLVGGVCSAEATEPPPGVLEPRDASGRDGGPRGAAPYRMALRDRALARVARRRYALEQRLVPDPFHLAAERLYRRLPPAPAWLGAENAILVPWMSGFRMSFRAEAIRAVRFDEDLGAYALFEDTDACFGVLRHRLLVGARNAQIYHHKAPARRADGRALGAMQILNRAYVLARAGVIDPETRRALRRFDRYKAAQYLAGARGAFGRQRLLGALAAMRAVPLILDAGPEALPETYARLRAGIIAGEG